MVIGGNMKKKYKIANDLSCWFGLSYASFLVLPRVLMYLLQQQFVCTN
jgi:hypothetical protein